MEAELYDDSLQILWLKKTLSPEDYHNHDIILWHERRARMKGVYHEDLRQQLILVMLRTLHPRGHGDLLEVAKSSGVLFVIGGVRYRRSTLCLPKLISRDESLYDFFGAQI